MSVANKIMERKTSEQMAQVIRARLQELHAIAPGSIGDLMNYELLGCDPDKGLYRMRCHTFDWMRNGPGTLHGGMCATVVDQAMGFIAYCIKPGQGIAPTVQMQVEYHRSLIPGQAVLVDVYVVSTTKSLMHLRAEAYAEIAPEKVCLTASATFFYKPTQG